MGRPPAPNDLNAAQTTLWKELAASYSGTVREVDRLLLRSVIDVASRIEEVRRLLDAEGIVVAGSKGQPRGHPLLAAESRLRTELAKRVSEWEAICEYARYR